MEPLAGVAIGAGGTLYIGRNGQAEIRQVNNPSGTFIIQFATTSGRTEDLTCDPITYAPLEAILSKDAFNGLYEAFEVEPGTCPLSGGGAIPAVSEWGLAIMALLLLTGAKIYFGRRRSAEA